MTFPTNVWDGGPIGTQNHGSSPTAAEWDAAVKELQQVETDLIGDGVPVSGAAAGAGVTASNTRAKVQRTVLSFSGLSVTMTDATTAGSHGFQKIYDFPEGIITILGVSTNLQIVAGAGGISDTAAVVAALGSAAVQTDNATLTLLEADIIPSTPATLTGGAGVVKGHSVGVNFGGISSFNGATTPLDMHLNFAVPDADSSANDTLTVDGTIEFIWVHSGDH